MKRRLTLAALVALLAIPITVPAVSAHAAGPGYVTFQFGRSVQEETLGNTCQITAGALTLTDVAGDLAAHGLTATGTVVTQRASTDPNTRTCVSGDLYANWADLVNLNTTYGWQFVSDGQTHGDMTQMTYDQQVAESCGSLPAFDANGLSSATAAGLFAFGGNKWTKAIMADPVAGCFSYGRTYRTGVNVRATMAAPWLQRTNSITGGACNTIGLPCFTGKSGKHYMNPVHLAAMVASVSGDQWLALQFYKIVTGSGPQWDCSSADWTLHWTTQPETYCQNDLDLITGVVPVGVVVTDPATVAAAWGRAPGASVVQRTATGVTVTSGSRTVHTARGLLLLRWRSVNHAPLPAGTRAPQTSGTAYWYWFHELTICPLWGHGCVVAKLDLQADGIANHSYVWQWDVWCNAGGVAWCTWHGYNYNGGQWPTWALQVGIDGCSPLPWPGGCSGHGIRAWIDRDGGLLTTGTTAAGCCTIKEW